MNWTREMTHRSPESVSAITGDVRKILISYRVDSKNRGTTKVHILRQHFIRGQQPPVWEAREATFIDMRFHDDDPRIYLTDADHAWLAFKDTEKKDAL